MPVLKDRVPRYTLHKASGRGRVRLGGQDIMLPGPYGSAESRQRYDALVAEWLSSGRKLPPSATTQDAAPVVTVRELIERWNVWAAGHYRRPDGSATNEIHNHQAPLEIVLRLYGRLPVTDFGPLKLKAVIGEMVRKGWVRRGINLHRGRIVRVFRWGVAEELVPASVVEALKAVPGLQVGRTDAVESEPVLPVPDADVEKTLPHLPRHVADMIRLLRLTGCRAGELCVLRPADVDKTGDVWRFRPSRHKLSYKGRPRDVPIGPLAQRTLAPYLDACLSAEEVVFSPAKSEAQRRAERTAGRKVPKSCGNVVGSNRKRSPVRTPASVWTTGSLGNCVRRACRKAGIAPWHLHQLRHAAATALRSVADLDVASTVLGHATTNMTEVYAARDWDKAAEVIRRIG